jgi:hypothetical protein
MGAIFCRETMIAVFTTLGTIATSIMCYLAWKSICVSQRQFATLNAAQIVAKLTWSDTLVLLVLENTGAMPAGEVSVEFPPWFNKELDNLNAESNYVKSMTDVLRDNRRPIQGHMKLPFLLCRNKTKFYEVMRPCKTVRVSMTWRDVNGKMRRNTHDIDLVDEVILNTEPLEKIAFALNTNSNNGLAAEAKRIADGICEGVAPKKVFKVSKRDQNEE